MPTSPKFHYFGVAYVNAKVVIRTVFVKAIDRLKGMGAMKTALPRIIELDLVKYILQMESMLFGLSMDDVRVLAFQLAEYNGLQHPFNRMVGKAGWDWVNGFRKRHPTVVLRTPEARGFNRPNVLSLRRLRRLLSLVVRAHQFRGHSHCCRLLKQKPLPENRCPWRHHLLRTPRELTCWPLNCPRYPSKHT